MQVINKIEIMKHLFVKFTAMCLFLAFSLVASAQEKGKIGLSYTLDGGASTVQLKSSEGGGYSSVDNFASVGFIYMRPLKNWLELETGLNYSLYNLRNSPAPMIDAPTTTSSVSLIDIPVGVRATFLKYIFANGGLMLDMDMNSGGGVSNQIGVGVMLGLGVKYDFKFGGSIFFNPNIKWHSLLPFSMDSYHQSLVEGGWKIGVTYKL
jgi:hypothetical protein